jgi:hypothetical protein
MAYNVTENCRRLHQEELNELFSLIKHYLSDNKKKKKGSGEG